MRWSANSSWPKPPFGSGSYPHREVAPRGMGLQVFQPRNILGRAAVLAMFKGGIVSGKPGNGRPCHRRCWRTKIPASLYIGCSLQACLAVDANGEHAIDGIKLIFCIEGTSAGDGVPASIPVGCTMEADHQLGRPFPLVGCPVEGASVTALVIGAPGTVAHAEERGGGPVPSLDLQIPGRVVFSTKDPQRSMGSAPVHAAPCVVEGDALRRRGQGQHQGRQCGDKGYQEFNGGAKRVMMFSS